jgi:hypothetical protein
VPHVAKPRRLQAASLNLRDSIGGHPHLPAGTDWPVCPKSGKRMVFFFQFDVRPEFGLALAPRSHLLAFMSPTVNEIHSFETHANGAPVPERFWEKGEPHFKVYLFGPDVALTPHPEADPYLVPHAFDFEEDDDEHPFLAIGGVPRWYQDPELHPGFEFVCQLSEDYPFPRLPDAPKQPGSFSSTAYCLFLGNSMYLFARPEPTHPEEVWIVLQN